MARTTPYARADGMRAGCNDVSSNLPEEPDIPPEDADRAAKALMDFYRKGRASLRRLDALGRRDPAALRYGRKQETLEAEARHAGLNHDLMQKAWRLAEAYTEEDVRAICRKVRERPARFGYTHLVKLLSVSDRGLRQELLDQAIDGQWSTGDLQRAIQARRGRRPHVGKKPKEPKDVLEALVVLQGLCLKFNRWCDRALGKLPGKVQDATRKADQVVQEVGQAASEEINQRRRKRRKG
jgi:hypothetical protein